MNQKKLKTLKKAFILYIYLPVSPIDGQDNFLERTKFSLPALILIEKLYGTTFGHREIFEKHRHVVNRKLADIMQSQNHNYSTALACQLYWRNRPIDYGNRPPDLKKEYKLLLKSLKSENLQLRLSTIKMSTGRFWMLMNKENLGESEQLSEIKRILKKYSEEGVSQRLTAMRFWASMARRIFEQNQKSTIVTSPNIPLLIQIGIPFYSIFGNQSANGVFKILNKNSAFQKYMGYFVQKIKAKNSEDKKLKQILLTMLPWMRYYSPINIFSEDLDKIIFSCIDDQDPSISRSAITALAWCRKNYSIRKMKKKLREFLKSKDMLSYKTAISSLVLLYFREKTPEKSKKFICKILKQKEEVRKSAALGCEFFLLGRILKRSLLTELANLNRNPGEMIDNETMTRLLKKYRNKKELLCVLDFAQNLLNNTPFLQDRKNHLYRAGILYYEMAKKSRKEKNKFTQKAFDLLSKSIHLETNPNEVDMCMFYSHLLKAEILEDQERLQKSLLSLSLAEKIYPLNTLIHRKIRVLRKLRKDTEKFSLQLFISTAQNYTLLAIIRTCLKKHHVQKAIDICNQFVLQCCMNKLKRSLAKDKFIREYKHPKWQDFLRLQKQ